jgi:hypothetical protein
MTTFLTGARETVAPRRGGRDGLLPPLLAAMFLGALAGALLVLHVHIVYPLVIALVILAAVAIIAVAWARNPRTTAT